RQHRDAEPVGHPHQPLRLAVALGPRHAEIVLEAAFGRGALLVPDDADALAAEAAEAGDDRRVVTGLAVAPERDEIPDPRRDIVETMRPLGMAGNLGLLPRRELGVEILECLRRLGFEAGDLLADGGGAVRRLERAQLLDLSLELGHRLLEVEVAAHRAGGQHGGPSSFARGPFAIAQRASRTPQRSYSPPLSPF